MFSSRFTVFPQKKSKDHFGLEGDEESTMLEDSVSPKRRVCLKSFEIYVLISN